MSALDEMREHYFDMLRGYIRDEKTLKEKVAALTQTLKDALEERDDCNGCPARFCDDCWVTRARKLTA